MSAAKSPPILSLGIRAFRDTFRFRGRSRRLELVEFYVISMLLGCVVKLVQDSGLSISGASPAEGFLATEMAYDAALALLYLPGFALMVRRLHDMNLPGWPLPPLLICLSAINEWKYLALITAYQPRSLWGSLTPLVPAGPPPGWVELLTVPIALVGLIVCLAPGTRGPNRYGPDPIPDPQPTDNAATNPL